MDNGRKIPGTIALIGLVVLGFSSWLMVQRVRAFHHEHPRVVYAFQPLDQREFTFAGRPVALSDDKSDPADPKLIVTYGETRLPLSVAIPGKWDLPGLASHNDWLRVLRFALKTGLNDREFDDMLASGKDRLALVTRTPPQGVDPKTWGSVWKVAWIFDFYELMPDGNIFHEQLHYPTKTGNKKPVEGELQENTWQFQAALQLMPNAGQTGPTRNFYGDALKAAGIALPLAAFSGLAAALGIAFYIAPRKRTV